MPQVIDLGRIRFYFKGDYNAATTYELNDVIKYGGSGFVYVNTIADSGNLPTDTNFWAKMTDGIQYENTFDPATQYQENDVVLYGSQAYIALQDTIGNLPTNTTYWTTFAGGLSFTGNWATATEYYPNDLVLHGGNVYIATAYHTSTAAFSADVANWSVFVSGVNNRGTWTASTEYYVNDLVNDGVSTYIAIDDHTSDASLFSNDSVHWQIFVAGADNLPSQIGYANHLLATDGTNPYWTPDIDIDGAVISGVAYIGSGAQTFETSAGLTDAVAVFNKTGGQTDLYAQIAFHNDEPTSSTDIIAYSSDGSDSEGWVDMGITGPSFTAAEFGITGPHDGYVFVNVPAGTTGAGNLVIATGANGTDNNIVLAAGGFDSGRTQMTIIPDNRVHIEIDTDSTSPTSGALTVAGGVGILGNLNVAGSQSIVGDVTIEGSISVAGGQFITENLSSTDPLLFVGNQNEANAVDLGYMTEAKFPTGTTTRFLFDTYEVTSGVATFTAASYNVTNYSVLSNVVELTIGTHSFVVGDPINVASVDASVNGIQEVTGITGTTIKYSVVTADVTSQSATGTATFYIDSGERGTLIAGDFVTISGAGVFDGAHHIQSSSATQMTFNTTESDTPETTISPDAVGTRDTRSKYSGLVKENTDGAWYLFSNLEVRPSTTVDFSLPEINYDPLKVGYLTTMRGVNIYANDIARDAEITDPIHGTIVYRTDKSVQEVYTGSKWDAIDPIHPFLLMGV